MDAKETGKRVKIARESFSAFLTQADLARELGVSQPVVSNWERGRNGPSSSMAKRIVQLLNIKDHWLATGEGPMRDEPEVVIVNDPQITEGFASTVALPVWRGILAAGSWSDECIFELDGLQEIPIFFLRGGAAHASEHAIARVAGLSMSPRIGSGESCIIYLDPVPKPNSISLVKSPDGRAYLKALRQTGNSWKLESVNKGGITIEDLAGYELVGHAIAIIGGDDREGANIEWRGGRPLKV